MKADLLRLDIFCDRNDGSEFGGSIYQKVSDNLETAVNLAWTAGNNSTRFGIAAKYQLDSSASLSVSRFPYLFFFFFFFHFSSSEPPYSFICLEGQNICLGD